MAKKEGQSELTPGLKKEIVELVIKTYREEVERQHRLQFDKRLRNTKLLLVNYRGLLAYSESAIFEASQCDEDVYDILSLMSGKSSEQELYVESIKKSAGRTKLIIEHIKRAISDYEAYCVRTRRSEEMRRLRTVKRLYIDDDAWTVTEIAKDELVDVSTVYKDIKEAEKRLTPRLFGIDGIR